MDFVESHKASIISDLSTKEISWTKWIKLCDKHLVLQAMHSQLLRHDLLGHFPSEIIEHLKMVHDLNKKRNDEIVRQVHSINALLNAKNIYPVYFKGVGNILDNLYPDPAQRIFLDIDFLVAEKDWEKSAEILKLNGYESSYTYKPELRDSLKHYPRLYIDHQPGVIEIHRLAIPDKYKKHISTNEVLKHKRHPELTDLCFVMSLEHMAIQNFIHSQLQHKSHLYARTFLRNLYDLLVISKKVDVFDVLSRYKGYPRKAAGYLDIFQRSFSLPAKSYPKPSLYLHLFSARYHAVLKPGPIKYINFFFAYFSHIIMRKVFISYIQLPILALFKKNKRQYLTERFKDPNIIKKQLRVLTNLVKGKR
ncbi:MAG: nucleotidyltransferase family protein [Bacteroidales bacterium]